MGGARPEESASFTHAIATILSLQLQQTLDFKTQSTKCNLIGLCGKFGKIKISSKSVI